MNKTLLYAATGILLGLSLILVPLVSVAEISPPERIRPYFWSRSFSQLDPYEGRGFFSSADLEALAASFFVALAVYALFKLRTPRRDVRRAWPYPY